MAHNKIFPLNLNKSKINALADEIDLDFDTYYFSIIWPKNEFCKMSTIQLRTHNDEPWTVIDSNISSGEGEITIKLGDLSRGVKIQLTWIIRAVTKISSMALFVTNGTTKKTQKVAPANGTKSMTSGEDWIDENLSISLP